MQTISARRETNISVDDFILAVFCDCCAYSRIITGAHFLRLDSRLFKYSRTMR